MNYLLDLTGALIYFVCSIVISPLIMILQCMLFLIAATRYLKAYQKSLRKARERNRLKENATQYPWNFELVMQKLHAFGYKR